MAGIERYPLEPAWILTAPNVTDPIGDWYNLGYTQGNVVASVLAGRVITNKVDQLGSIPLASAVYLHPNGFELTFPLIDKSIDTLLKVAPGAVKLTNSSKDAFAFTSGVKPITGRAFAIVPISEYTEDEPWWQSDGVIYVFCGVANVGGKIQGFKEYTENDLDAYEVTVTHLNKSIGRGGIGPLWILDGGTNVVGFNDTDSFEYAVPDEDTRTALNGESITTARGLVDTTGAIDISGGTLVSPIGLEYAFRSSGIDVSDNSISESVMSDFIGRLWKVRSTLGLANCAIDISGNNGIDATATAQINGTGAYLYAIAAADTTNDAFTVAGDRRAAFYPGRKFEVESSTGNDGTYTAADKQVIHDGANNQTIIFVDETVSDATADGSVNDGLVGAGCTVVTS